MISYWSKNVFDFVGDKNKQFLYMLYTKYIFDIQYL